MSREDRLAEAGDFVLGLMEDKERADFEASCAGDPELAAMVDAFAARLHALDAEARPATVPAGLWTAIEARLAATPQDRAALAAGVVRIDEARRGRRPPGWSAAQLTAMAATVLLALGVGYLAGARMIAPPEPVAIAVLLDPADGMPGAIVEAYGDDSVRLEPLRAFAVPEGRIMQVWTLPDQQTGPVSLGTLARSAGERLSGPDLPAPKEGQLYEITLEPAPRSPTGRPTGPILVKGFARLTRTGA